MNSTAAVLRRIKDFCTKQDTCRECPLDRMFCETSPEHWTNEEIEDMADLLDDYEEEEEKDV